MTSTPSLTRTSSQRGFSAVEVIAVATIIAILALILIPILTRQVEKSRAIAVTDEMSNFAKFTTLAAAETNHYFRLQDYDNTAKYNNPPQDPTTEVPVITLGSLVPMSVSERARLKDNWDGSKTIFHKFATINDLYVSFPDAFTFIQAPPGTGVLQPGGPIIAAVTAIPNPQTTPPDPPTGDERRDLYPLDPWGNPYLFFAPNMVITIPTVITNESVYSPVVYSLGPDGLPGSPGTAGPPITAKDYYPFESGGLLGKPDTDDITWKF